MTDYNKSILKLIIEDINQIEYSDNELDNELINMGVDPEKLASDGVKRINALRAKQKIRFAKKRQTLLDKALAKLQDFRKEIDNPKKKLMELFTNSESSQLQAFYSKIESIDDYDALETLSDALLLDIVEKLESQQGDE